MLGRKDFTPQELDSAKDAMSKQLAAYRKLAKAVRASGDAKAVAALEAFEPLCFNNLTLALDRRFVHRVRMVSGKDTNALNEVELIADSLMDNGGTLEIGTVIKYTPDEATLGLAAGDRIALGADEFDRLAKAFLSEIDAKFVG